MGDLFPRYAPDSGPLAGLDRTLALNNAGDEYFAVFPVVVPQPGRSRRRTASYRFGRCRARRRCAGEVAPTTCERPGRRPSPSSVGGRLGPVAGERRGRSQGIEESDSCRVVDLFPRYAPDSGPLAGMDRTLALNNATDEYFAVFPAVVPRPSRRRRLTASYRFGR